MPSRRRRAHTARPWPWLGLALTIAVLVCGPWVAVEAAAAHRGGPVLARHRMVLRSTRCARGTLSFGSILPPIFQRRPAASATAPGGGEGAASGSVPPTASPPIETTRKDERLAELGFSFSPAGLLLPYHLGVASLLRDRRVITPATPLGGSSAGALVAAIIGLDIPVKRALEACYEINESWGGALLMGPGGVLSLGERWANFGFNGNNGNGNNGNGNNGSSGPPRGTEDLKTLLHRVLDEVLPQDAHVRLNKRPSPVTVGVTQLALAPLPRLFLRPQAIQTFTSREDLIECLLASCCVPFWFTPGPFVSCRGAPAVDGYFSVPTHRFGCPYVPSQRTVLVSPFPAPAVARGGSPGSDEAAAVEWLSPQLAVDREVAAAAAAVASGREAVAVVQRAGMRQLLKDALSANAREQVKMYYEQGRKDAQLWMETSEFKRAAARGGSGGKLRSGGGFPLL